MTIKTKDKPLTITAHSDLSLPKAFSFRCEFVALIDAAVGVKLGEGVKRIRVTVSAWK